MVSQWTLCCIVRTTDRRTSEDVVTWSEGRDDGVWETDVVIRAMQEVKRGDEGKGREQRGPLYCNYLVWWTLCWGLEERQVGEMSWVVGEAGFACVERGGERWERNSVEEKCWWRLRRRDGIMEERKRPQIVRDVKIGEGRETRGEGCEDGWMITEDREVWKIS